MNKWFVFLVAVLLSLPVVSGCGQKQEPMSKSSEIKPVEVMSETEEVDIEEESVSENAPEQSGSVTAKAAAVSAPAPVSTQAPSVPTPAAPVAEAPKPSETLMLADFNSGEKPNNVGGNFGAWNKDPSDPTQWCKEAFDNVVRYGESGFSMKLDYSVDSPNPAYNGFWMMLPNLDASKYDTVNLWVKGDPQAGYTTVFKIEIKNANRQVGRYYVSNVSDQWKQVSIPLSEFKGLIDKTSLTEFVIVFEDRMATKKKGTIYIDDITFTKK
jgi:hypothetical protein